MNPLSFILGLVQAIVWPTVITVALLVLVRRNDLQGPLSDLLRRVTGVSAFAIGIQLVPPFTPPQTGTSLLDMEQPSTLAGITSTAAKSLYKEIEDNTPAICAVIDLATGNRWLTSRLYIYAVMLAAVRGLKCVVFLETSDNGRGKFLGIATPERLRLSLAYRYPWLEAVFVKAVYAQILRGQIASLGVYYPQSTANLIDDFLSAIAPWFFSYPTPAVKSLESANWERPSDDNRDVSQMSGPTLYTVDGHLDPLTANAIAQAFLEDKRIQRRSPPVPGDGWVELGSGEVYEHAHWLDGARLERILGDGLQRFAWVQDSPMITPGKLENAVLRRKEDFIAIVEDGLRFKGIASRRALLERVVEKVATQQA